MVAFRPEVEKLGLVLPSLNAPHSACPRAPQPFGLRASASRSPQPSWAFGQPRASAIGLGMAITSGVWAIDGRSLGIGSARSLAAVRCRTSTVHEDEAGDQTSGRGPSASSQLRLSASAAAPEDLAVTRTSTHAPFTWRFARL